MGGKAFGIELPRIHKQDYDKIVSKVEHRGVFNVKEILSKDSFGDIDFVYSLYSLDFLKGLMDYLGFSVGGIKVNGNITSLLVDLPDTYINRTVQMDFIKHKPNDEAFALSYYSNNILGELLGRVATIMGYKLTPTGLYYIQLDENGNKVGEHLVSNEWSIVLNILGYSKEHPKQFSSKEDLFDYIAKGKYFNSTTFIDRYEGGKRNSRGTKEFIEFLKEDYITQCKYVNIVTRIEIEDRLEEALMVFGVDINIKERELQLNRDRSNRELFSGDYIKNRFDLEGKELGEFMEFCKRKVKSISDKDWVELNFLGKFNSTILRLYDLWRNG